MGNDYNLNWAIAGYNMTATGNAYHNLHLRGLTMLTSGSLDANKAVLQETDASQGTDRLLIVGQDIPDGAFGGLVKRAREQLTDAKSLFVHDGSLGLSRDAGPTVRSFSTSGDGALMLHHLLRSFRLPLSDDGPGDESWIPEDLRNNASELARQVRRGTVESPPVVDPHALTQFLVGPMPHSGLSDDCVSQDSFSVVDVKRRIVLHVGHNVTVARVRAGLLSLADHAGLWENDSIQIAADAFLVDQSSVLVFGGAGAGAVPWSAHNTLVRSDGSLVPVWNSGAVENATTQFGDYVEHSKSSSVVLGRRRTPLEVFVAPPPKALLFVDSSLKKGPQRINPEQARKLGLPGSLVDRVAKTSMIATAPRASSVSVDKWIGAALSLKK